MRNQATQTVMVQQQIQWHKPSFCWFKCNVDAGFHNVHGKTSMGWCIRDHDGRFVVAGTSWKYGNCSIIEGEVWLYLML
ncbi:unnamed protein product [Trifolium pratense]|uniref:Uncharacterized protein n=1 Tax=Trifolium pratense TaxID=57577 RepID=A0ACB0LBJ1_TRIPR|nr:unnamed protein product [Trifolium pratense]